MLYPIIWMIGASFKSNNEIFTSIGFVPSTIDFQAYIDGWDTKGDYTFTLYFINTFKYVIPKIVLLLFQQLLQRTGLPDLIFRLKSDVLTFDGNDVLPQVVTRIPCIFLESVGFVRYIYSTAGKLLFRSRTIFVL